MDIFLHFMKWWVIIAFLVGLLLSLGGCQLTQNPICTYECHSAYEMGAFQ